MKELNALGLMSDSEVDAITSRSLVSQRPYSQSQINDG